MDDGNWGTYYLVSTQKYTTEAVIPGTWTTSIDLMGDFGFGPSLLSDDATASIDTSEYNLVISFAFMQDGTFTQTYDSNSIDKAKEVLYNRMYRSLLDYSDGDSAQADALINDKFANYNAVLDNMKGITDEGTYEITGPASLCIDGVDNWEINFISQNSFFTAVDNGNEGIYLFSR